MTTTPPPPSRVRTPPAPLHGPMHDSYEPYSPRRSSRLSSRREPAPFNGNANQSPSRSYSSRSQPETIAKAHSPTSAASSTPRKRPTFKKTSSQHLSPPSSPMSPSQDSAIPVHRRRNMGDHDNIRQPPSKDDPDSDLDTLDPVARVRDRNIPGIRGMLPTPAKTPKKRGLHDEAHLHSTARVLFPSRPATVEEAMPTPRKSRKGKRSGFTLDALDTDAHDDEKITIYTDSKERIPEKDDGEDNPFLVRRSNRKTGTASDSTSVRRSSQKTKHGMTKEIDEAVERGEGMVYVFRGKKMFRKFDDTNNGTGEQETIATSDIDLPRQAGAAAQEPLARTSLKPRLLFPPKETTPDPDDVDEEAVTDIEAPATASADEGAAAATTPVKRSFRPPTPPTTVRKRKTPAAAAVDANVNEDDVEDFSMGLDGASDYLQVPQGGSTSRKKSTLFDSWRRTKPSLSGKPSGDSGTRAVSGKRPVETLENISGLGDFEAVDDSGVGRGKRSRSGPA